MLKFEPTREGYLVTNDQGRTLCRVETRRVAQKRVTQPPDNRVVFIEEHEAIRREEWVFHFCAGKRSLTELEALLDELPAS